MNNLRVSLLLLVCTALVLTSFSACSEEVKKGEEITIVTPDVLARLCPSPNCGSEDHITRIAEGSELNVEGITVVKTGMLKTKWFEVTYEGKRGWVSIYDTNKQ